MSDVARTYRVDEQPDGSRSITCLLCQTTSRHPGDVSELYCGRCQHFHEDPRSNQEGAMRHELTYRQMAASAYAAYTRNVVGRNFQGLPLPTWDDLPTHRQTAWEVVVRQVEVCLLTPEDAAAKESSWSGWQPPTTDPLGQALQERP